MHHDGSGAELDFSVSYVRVLKDQKNNGKYTTRKPSNMEAEKEGKVEEPVICYYCY